MSYTSIQTNSTVDLAKAKLFLRLDADDTTLDSIVTIRTERSQGSCR